MSQQLSTPGHHEQSVTPENKERLSQDEPRIYVASLSDYNAGRLHGAWINANQEPEEIGEAITAMLNGSKEPIAEEWAIHDYEGFGPLHLSEFESIEHISALGQGIAEHGPAFAHWANHLGTSEWNRLGSIEDHYLGHWNSTTEFAATILDDMGLDIDSLVDERLQPYVRLDLDAFARDLSFDFDIAEDDDGVYVFDTI